MINRVYISDLNPLDFTEYGITPLPQYNTKYMDEYPLHERLDHWQYGDYYQPFQNNDVIHLQFQNNIGQMQIELIDCAGRTVPGSAFLLSQVSQNKLDPDFFIYEGSISLADIDPGKYFVIINIGSNPVKKVIISNGIEVKELHENTLLFEYSHPSYYENMIFLTGIKPNIRLHGVVRSDVPQSKDTLFEDQNLNVITVKSSSWVPVTLYIFGEAGGIPDFISKKIIAILGCRNLKIDGKYFSKEPGAKLEKGIDIENGTLVSYKIQLRESLNRNSKVFSVDENINEEIIMMLNVDSKGFADTTTGSNNIIRILNVE